MRRGLKSSIAWHRALLGGVVAAAVQAAFLVFAMVLWRWTAGSWRGPAWAGYALGMVLLVPVVAWECAARFGATNARAIDAWPLSLVSLVVLFYGHGFEEAGLPLWAPVATLAVLSTMAGTLGLRARGVRRTE